MAGERNESEEPLSVNQEAVRDFNKMADDSPVINDPVLTEQTDLPADAAGVLDEMTAMPEMQVELPADNPLEAPGDSAPTQQVQQLFERPETPRPPGAILPPRKSPSAQPLPTRQPLRKQTYTQAKAAQKAARQRAEHGQVMVELAENIAQPVPDAQPVNPADMPRGEAERLVFPGGEQPDALTHAYRDYMTEDKEWRSTLAKLLREHAGELRQSRLELDEIRCLLERDRI